MRLHLNMAAFFFTKHSHLLSANPPRKNLYGIYIQWSKNIMLICKSEILWQTLDVHLDWDVVEKKKVRQFYFIPSFLPLFLFFSLQTDFTTQVLYDPGNYTLTTYLQRRIHTEYVSNLYLRF